MKLVGAPWAAWVDISCIALTSTELSPALPCRAFVCRPFGAGLPRALKRLANQLLLTARLKSCPSRTNSRMTLLQRCLLFDPGVVIFLRLHFQIGLHVVVAQAAQLGADNFVLTDFGRREVNRDIQTRNEILLDAEFGNIEGMSHIFG